MSDTDATEATGARQVPWREFFTWFRRTWRQGEHVSLIGPTGSGKTTLGIHLIALRPYVTAFAVKPQDDTMHKLLRAGYMLEREWVPELSDHIVLWPRYKALGDMEHMHQAFLDALNRGVRMGGWCFFIDEVAFVTAELRMERELRVLWQIARSTGVTIVAGTQRPAHVPLVMYDQATHLFLWNDNDERNLARIGGLGGISKRQIIEEVSSLAKHEVLYVNTITRQRTRTKVEL